MKRTAAENGSQSIRSVRSREARRPSPEAQGRSTPRSEHHGSHVDSSTSEDQDSNRMHRRLDTSSRQEETTDLSYPNPRTFPERLMTVLQSRACPQTIWWENSGKAVALHVANLKRDDVLKTHFQDIKYKFFIRYMTRWGFKRNTDSSVPKGLFFYQNSLFQRQKPHMVKYMRMDSDVQRVFAQHESGAEFQPIQQTQADLVEQQASSDEQPSHSQSDETRKNQGLLSTELGQNVSQQNQNNSAVNLPVSLQDASALIASLVNLQPDLSLVRSFGSRATLLQQIMMLTAEYLNQTDGDSTLGPQESIIRTILQLLQTVGRQQQEVSNQSLAFQQLFRMQAPNSPPANAHNRTTGTLHQGGGVGLMDPSILLHLLQLTAGQGLNGAPSANGLGHAVGQPSSFVAHPPPGQQEETGTNQTLNSTQLQQLLAILVQQPQQDQHQHHPQQQD